MSARISETISGKYEGETNKRDILMAANKMRKNHYHLVSVKPLLVAGFGIYNILNMTRVSKKLTISLFLKLLDLKREGCYPIFVNASNYWFLELLVVLDGSILITILKMFYRW